MGVGGETDFHEVMGSKGRRYFAREDAKLKIKVAARLYPKHRFKIVWQMPDGGWAEEAF